MAHIKLENTAVLLQECKTAFLVLGLKRNILEILFSNRLDKWVTFSVLNVDPYDMVFGFSITQVPVYKTHRDYNSNQKCIEALWASTLATHVVFGEDIHFKKKKIKRFCAIQNDDHDLHDYCCNDDYGFDYDDEDDQIHPNTMTLSKK